MEVKPCFLLWNFFFFQLQITAWRLNSAFALSVFWLFAKVICYSDTHRRKSWGLVSSSACLIRYMTESYNYIFLLLTYNMSLYLLTMTKNCIISWIKNKRQQANLPINSLYSALIKMKTLDIQELKLIKSMYEVISGLKLLILQKGAVVIVTFG